MSLQPQHAEIGLTVTCDNPKCQNQAHMGYYDPEEPVDATNTYELAARAHHARVDSIAYFADRGWTTGDGRWWCPNHKDPQRQDAPPRTYATGTTVRIEPNLAGPRIITKPTHITTPGDTQ